MAQDASTEWFDSRTLERMAKLFAANGIDAADVRVKLPVARDEVMFVVPSAGWIPERSLTQALMELLARKVWITTFDGEEFGIELRPLDWSGNG